MSIPHHAQARAGHIPVQYESASPLTPKVTRAEAAAAGRRALQQPPMHGDSVTRGTTPKNAQRYPSQ